MRINLSNKTDKKTIGLHFENLAVNYLKSYGYKILERNFKTKFGEIDIIAYDKKDKCIVFVEVRYRHNTSYGLPEETVNNYKQKRIVLSAISYIKSRCDKKTNQNYRFDIVAISGKNNINHIKNAFMIDKFYF